VTETALHFEHLLPRGRWLALPHHGSKPERSVFGFWTIAVKSFLGEPRRFGDEVNFKTRNWNDIRKWAAIINPRIMPCPVLKSP
jgi:hypothetical protein